MNKTFRKGDIVNVLGADGFQRASFITEAWTADGHVAVVWAFDGTVGHFDMNDLQLVLRIISLNKTTAIAAGMGFSTPHDVLAEFNRQFKIGGTVWKLVKELSNDGTTIEVELGESL